MIQNFQSPTVLLVIKSTRVSQFIFSIEVLLWWIRPDTAKLKRHHGRFLPLKLVCFCQKQEYGKMPIFGTLPIQEKNFFWVLLQINPGIYRLKLFLSQTVKVYLKNSLIGKHLNNDENQLKTLAFEVKTMILT